MTRQTTWHDRKFVEKRCIGCGSRFVPTVGNQKRCQAACGLQRACVVCGKEFVPHRHKRVQTTCSHQCSSKAMVLAKKACRKCGTMFQPGSNRGTYCSEGCQLGDSTCRTCGKVFTLTPNTKGKFCSMECHYAYYAPIGTTKLDQSGYVLVKTDKRTDRRRRWDMQHRVVMEQVLGRTLLRTETVHHKDGNKANNDPSNLELWKGNHGRGIRSKDYHCPGCRCFEAV